MSVDSDWLPYIKGCVQRTLHSDRYIHSYIFFFVPVTSMSVCVWGFSLEHFQAFKANKYLWQAIVEENVPKKKDRLALSTIFSVISKETMTVLDAKKTIKEN
ncbi:unnamed protein product [Spirodela intermedia]|uniref:Uncharacterized protein n=1 Tax=Spirodela intermedia TaxID=51605 RepID=A0A7I8IMA3_SPIIN|nr:unnamed protein product [Spirodela intermedia]CAA6658275.1 unnamed protein product [Spirodela intermedia]